MPKNMVLYLFLCVFFIIEVNSFTSVNPTWVTNSYFRSDNARVINSNTNGGATRTRTFFFSSSMTGIPSIAYGTDKLSETNFEIKKVSLTSSSFRVSVQLFGTSSMYQLQVQYFAVDPSFPFHLNAFQDVPIEYNSTLTNITAKVATLTSFTQVIDYSQQSAANTFKTFTAPLSYNKIVLYITSLMVTTQPTAAYKLSLSYLILNTTHYSMTATIFHYGTATNLRLSQIIYNDYDIKLTDFFIIVNYNWFDDGTGSSKVFQSAFEDNMICGLTYFGTRYGNCALDYEWDYNNNIPGSYQNIDLSRSQPSANSSATCGQNDVRTTLFFIKSWDCPNSYKYFNLTSDMCQNACASYYYYNTTALTCTQCYYSCYNCSLPSSQTSCSQCETGLKRQLVNNTCICSSGYFDDGFEPACKACADVDPKSLTCTYTIDPLELTSFYQNIFNQTTWATDILPNFTSITCVTAYFVNTSRLCQPCPSYCITCTDSVTCTTCNSSSPAILYSNNLCYLCNLTNCLSCYPDNICVSCSGVLVVSQGVCMTCVQACVCQGWVLPKISGVCSTLCGDGIKVGLEECDDGNTNDHDGCSSTCILQPCSLSCLCDGWTAPWNGGNSSCTSICGDGLLRGNQQCDDGNIFDHDGCSSTCQNEPCSISCQCSGWVLPWSTSSCSTLCGDGIKVGGQQCDDGNLIDHDGCSSSCTLEPCHISCLCDGWTYPWIVQNSSCTTICGDGYRRGIEQCDDGNLLSGDGCDNICHLEPPVLVTSAMSQYPALILFALGFRIVGLQTLNVFQSFQLILDSIKMHSFQVSFNIHGYTDQSHFPISIPSNQHFLNKFNFMYIFVIGIFIIGAVIQIYNLCCNKQNKILDSNDHYDKKQIKQGHSQVQDNNDDNGDDFAVHIKGESKLKVNQSNITPIDQSTYFPKQQQKQFWGILIFRQVFFDLIINLLSVFVYSIVDHIRSFTMESFLNLQTLIVLISMLLLFASIGILFVFRGLTFGENLLKLKKGQVLQYWLLMIGEKIVFSAILGSKSFWNLQIILILKYFLLTYYCCTRLYFEHLQKVRSVVTHFLHFMLIFAVILNEHIFKNFGIYQSFSPLFMEYIYVALLCLVLLICVIFYVREIMHDFSADFRQLDDNELSVNENGMTNAIFDVKNFNSMQESAQQLTMKGPSIIMDELKTKKNLRSTSAFLDIPTQVQQSSNALPKRKSNLSNINSSMASATSIGNLPNMTTKKNLQSHIRSQRGSNMMSVVQLEEQNQIEELDYKLNPVNHSQTPGINSSQIQIKLNHSMLPDGHISDQSSKIQTPSGFKNYARKLVLNNKKKLKQHDKMFRSDIQGEYEMGKQSGERFEPSYETDGAVENTRKSSRQMTFHKNQKHPVNYSQVQLYQPKITNQKIKSKIQSQVSLNEKNSDDNEDAVSINFE